MKLNGTGLTGDEFAMERQAWIDGYGVSDEFMITVLQWYMSPSMPDSVVSRAAHGMDFDVDDLQEWFDYYGDGMEDEHYQILDFWLAGQYYVRNEYVFQGL